MALAAAEMMAVPALEAATFVGVVLDMLDMLVLADVVAAEVDDVEELLLLDAELELELEGELEMSLEVVVAVAPGVVTAATLDREFAFFVALLAAAEDEAEAVVATTSVDVLCVVTTATVVDSSVVCGPATVVCGAA